MKLADALRAVARRWYVVVVGIVIATGAGWYVWTNVSPFYERSASQLLLPGSASIPEGSNPFLYIQSLSQASEVLALALSSETVVADATDPYPRSSVDVGRDFTTSGPVVRVTVTAATDDDAAALLDVMIDRTSSVLDSLQVEQNVPADEQVRVVALNVDVRSTLQQRDRIVATGGTVVGVLVVSLIVAGLVDGLARRRRRTRGFAAAHRIGRSVEDDVDG